MKTERLHELQQNDLAVWLNSAGHRFQKYWRAVLGVVLAVAAIYFCWHLIQSNSTRNKADAWEAYSSALGLESDQAKQEALEVVFKTYSDVPAGQFAEVELADMLLKEGIDSLFSNRVAGQKALKKAITHYEAVLLKDPSNELVSARATFGLARAHESLNELTAALDNYKRLTQATGSQPYALLARQRIESLSKPESQSWYNWFVKQEPITPFNSAIPGLTGERLPFTDGSLNSGSPLLDLGSPGNPSQPAGSSTPFTEESLKLPRINSGLDTATPPVTGPDLGAPGATPPSTSPPVTTPPATEPAAATPAKSDAPPVAPAPAPAKTETKTEPAAVPVPPTTTPSTPAPPVTEPAKSK
ncbi:MAG: hypothetical protein SGJ20_06965 [Planctomycetota bacterium]|nr:hypothetical protein [Planctomycetota bacterium]